MANVQIKSKPKDFIIRFQPTCGIKNESRKPMAQKKRGCRKRSENMIRKVIKKQLQYVKMNIGHVDLLMEQDDIHLSEIQLQRIKTIRELYEQQDYMYRNNTHSLKDCIVSMSQPYIRPIVRGKAKFPTEFGAKLDMSIDETGFARLERLSFNAYNEGDVLIGTIEGYRERTGHYPERVLVDQIYRNRKTGSTAKIMESASQGLR